MSIAAVGAPNRNRPVDSRMGWAPLGGLAYRFSPRGACRQSEHACSRAADPAGRPILGRSHGELAGGDRDCMTAKPG